uniref:Uncharacterized protein n=1 Tax=Anopheles darlingi TaxID=43151 RepID=A0A2M4DAS9_ANODA
MFHVFQEICRAVSFMVVFVLSQQIIIGKCFGAVVTGVVKYIHIERRIVHAHVQPEGTRIIKPAITHRALVSVSALAVVTTLCARFGWTILLRISLLPRTVHLKHVLLVARFVAEHLVAHRAGDRVFLLQLFMIL